MRLAALEGGGGILSLDKTRFVVRKIFLRKKFLNILWLLNISALGKIPISFNERPQAKDSRPNVQGELTINQIGCRSQANRKWLIRRPQTVCQALKSSFFRGVSWRGLLPQSTPGFVSNLRSIKYKMKCTLSKQRRIEGGESWKQFLDGSERSVCLKYHNIKLICVALRPNSKNILCNHLKSK